MALIPIEQIRPKFTDDITSTFQDVRKPSAFFSNFFKPTESDSRYVSIEVRRGTEKVSIDVPRGHRGELNTFENETIKTWDPPYHRQYFILNDSDKYYRVFGSKTVSSTDYAKFIDETRYKADQIADKIRRAEEIACKQVLEDGIIQSNVLGNITFHRKAASLKTAPILWGNSATAQPYLDMEVGCEFIRAEGGHTGGILDASFGANAWNAFLRSEEFKSRANFTKIQLDLINTPVKNGVGGIYQGQITVGSFIVRCWTYPGSYDDSSNNKVPYMNPDKVIIIADNAELNRSYAAVPKLMSNGMFTEPRTGAYHYGDYVDNGASAHIFDVKSAFIPIPVAVDKIYTLKVL